MTANGLRAMAPTMASKPRGSRIFRESHGARPLFLTQLHGSASRGAAGRPTGLGSLCRERVNHFARVNLPGFQNDLVTPSGHVDRVGETLGLQAKRGILS